MRGVETMAGRVGWMEVGTGFEVLDFEVMDFEVMDFEGLDFGRFGLVGFGCFVGAEELEIVGVFVVGVESVRFDADFELGMGYFEVARFADVEPRFEVQIEVHFERVELHFDHLNFDFENIVVDPGTHCSEKCSDAVWE